jgi:outer membrane usher protein
VLSTGEPSTVQKQLCLSLLPALILGALAPSAHSAELAAAELPASPAVSFDDNFFPKGLTPKVDLSRFEKANAVLPGTYRGDILLNGEWRARTEIVFAEIPGSDEVYPCYDRSGLESLGIDLDKVKVDTSEIAPHKAVPKDGQFCGVIGDYVPSATANFDPGSQTLSLSVPQLYTLRNARSYVDPKYWDPGINAAAINYNANAYRSSGENHEQTSAYLGLNAALNLGSWHVIHLGSGSWGTGRRGGYQSAATYLQHDIPQLKSQVQAGDVYTMGGLFDSISLRGIHMYTDDRMYPQSQRGFAPTVRGIADTNARVLVKQRGYTLLETSVAPGPFVIDDLYPTGGGGDIDVEVIEADGRVKRFIVPYSAVPQLLRPGQDRWEFSAGKMRQGNLRDTPAVLQATYQRGVTNAVTAYGGATLASGYQAALIGGALNTNVGAFSVDVTQARTQVRGLPIDQGVSVRVAYNKYLTQMGTNVGLAAYRYSTSGYHSLADLALLRDAAAGGVSSTLNLQPRRNELTATITQSLGDKYGQLYFAGTRRDYWGKNGRQVDFSLGYSNRWKSLTYSISAQRTTDSTRDLQTVGPIDRIPDASNFFDGSLGRNQRRDTLIYLSLSMPLGSTPSAPRVTALGNRSKLNGNTSLVTVSGTAYDDNRLGYNATLNHDAQGNAFNLSAQYNGGHGNLQTGYAQGPGYKQGNVGIAGGLVLHGGGYTWSPPLGETIGLVHARDAKGARVESNQRSVVDGNNYAVIPTLTPYQLNRVTLDPKDMSVDTELEESSQTVAPRARSVVLLKYKTNSGRALLIDSGLSDGKSLPFGAEVFDADGNNVGVTGQGGQVFVRGVEKSQELMVRWGEGNGNSCRIHVDIKPRIKSAKQADFEQLKAVCTL